ILPIGSKTQPLFSDGSFRRRSDGARPHGGAGKNGEMPHSPGAIGFRFKLPAGQFSRYSISLRPQLNHFPHESLRAHSGWGPYSHRSDARTADGLVSLRSTSGPKDAMNRLDAAVNARGMTVFGRIGHAAGATTVGLAPRLTTARGSHTMIQPVWR